MAIAQEFNTQFDPNEKFVWEIEFLENDDTPIDVSTWTFQFILTSPSSTTVWTINNADFTRPNNYTVSFEKSQATINALATGIYTFSFKVTNTDVTNDEWVSGRIAR